MPSHPQLCLELWPGPTALERLEAAFSVAGFASVTLRQGQTPLTAAACAPLIAAAQRHGAAALIEDDAKLARTLKADGVVVEAGNAAAAAYEEARSIVGKGAIVGVLCGRSRHAAMEAAEAGADFVAFSPRIATGADRDGQIDMIDWWAEKFEVPCVATEVDSADACRSLVEAGVDFLSVKVPEGATLDEIASLLRAIASATSTETAR